MPQRLPDFEIVAQMWLDSESDQAVATQLGCSRERIRQIRNEVLPSWLIALHQRRIASRKRLRAWAKDEANQRRIALKRTPWGRAEGKFKRGDGCWEWTASRTAAGYGHLYDGVGYAFAHRHVWEMYRGPIPDGLTIDHLCRNRGCVNPDHLEPVTMRVNVLRSDNPPAQNARKTHCCNGHELTPDNIYASALPQRLCIKCRREVGRHKRNKKVGQPA